MNLSTNCEDPIEKKRLQNLSAEIVFVHYQLQEYLYLLDGENDKAEAAKETAKLFLPLFSERTPVLSSSYLIQRKYAALTLMKRGDTYNNSDLEKLEKHYRDALGEIEAIATPVPSEAVALILHAQKQYNIPDSLKDDFTEALKKYQRAQTFALSEN